MTFSFPKRLFTTLHQEFLLDRSEFSPHQSQHTNIKWEGVGKPVDPWWKVKGNQSQPNCNIYSVIQIQMDKLPDKKKPGIPKQNPKSIAGSRGLRRWTRRPPEETCEPAERLFYAKTTERHCQIFKSLKIWSPILPGKLQPGMLTTPYGLSLMNRSRERKKERKACYSKNGRETKPGTLRINVSIMHDSQTWSKQLKGKKMVKGYSFSSPQKRNNTNTHTKHVKER